MSVRLRIGNSFDGNKPARATLKELRFGDGFCEEYRFKTLYPEQGGSGIIPNWPSTGHDVTVNPITQYFSHDGDIRMTGFADMFVPLTDYSWYSRQDVDYLVFECEDYRAEGTSTDANDEVGVKFKITRQTAVGSTDTATVWFDNASFRTTDILWEFNIDNGGGRWWPLYQIPGRNYLRVTVPRRTNSVRIRAYSSNPTEWVQKIVVFPRDDSDMSVVGETPISVEKAITIDNYGYFSWEPMDDGEGRAYYEVYGSNSSDMSGKVLIGSTSSCSYQLETASYHYCSVVGRYSASDDEYQYDVVENPLYHEEINI